MVLITVLYTAVVVSLHRQKTQIASHLSSEPLRRRAKQNRKITFMFITVVALFAVSFISFGVWLFLAMYSPHSLKKLCSYHFVSLSGLCPQCCKLYHILYVQRLLSSGFETIILQRHHLLSVMSRKSSFTSTIPGEQPACAADVEGVNHAS